MQKMDKNDDGRITLDEFIEATSKDKNLAESLELFNTKCFGL